MEEGSTTPGKHDRVDAPHARPLNTLIREWRARLPAAQIPWFDPDDGGIDARVLILMESPAPKTVGPTGSGFCSEDNDDPSNRLIRKIRTEAGLPRQLCLKWNAVPWAVLDSGGHPRAPSASEIDAATPYLIEVLDAAPNIEVVITLGKSALSGFTASTTLSTPRRLCRIAAAPHPSQRNALARDAAMKRIANAFQNAARYAAAPTW